MVQLRSEQAVHAVNLSCECLVDSVRRAGVTGVLLHGSRATTAGDSVSDYDLVCVLGPNQGRHTRETVMLGDAELDIYFASAMTLKRRLYTPAANNNNFVLNALISGRILFDSIGELAQLIVAARELWQAGPPVPAKDELILIHQQLKSALRSAQRKLSRAQDSASLRLVDIRFAEIYSKAVYTYCVQRGRWTSSLASVLEWARNSCTELYQPAHDFLISNSKNDGVRALERLITLLDHR